ncbi:histidinol-phosphatase [Prosthecobacter sp.]|uniref:histidinol-phosphatase n=1 Tax=Prosthecobacter sp. TaxID=1965333 RepID=UPI0025F26140|nr:histidinol-phosphatase [Prosthecobacter sp.]
MSKSNRTTKKAAPGKAKPAARKPGKAAPSKKPASKPAPAKKAAKAKSAPVKKPLTKKKPAAAKKPAPKKPVKKVSPPKPAAKKKAPAAKPAPKKPVVRAAVSKAKAPAPKAAVAKPAPKAAKPAFAKPAAKPAPAVQKAPKPAAAPAPAPAAAAVSAEPVKKGPSQPLPAPGPTKSGALFYDSHMHTPLCKHAWGEPEEYAQQAVKAGLKGIIFTCHCPMPNGFWPTVRMAESEFDTYVAMVQRAADAFKGKLDIRLGIESEYFPGCEEYITGLHQRANFHYVLGAVHWQAKEYLNKFETGTIENFRRTYFEHLAKSAESGLYDCLAHPDLVKNYHPDSWCFAIVKNTVSTALDRIAATGVAMELNTSGLNKSYSEMNPGLEMLRMMAERKIPVVIGSDSHRPVRVGEHFVTALNHLTEAGYEKVSYFLNRQRIDLKISDVLASLKKAADHNA